MKPIKEIEFYCKANTITKGGEIVYETFPVDSSREDKDAPREWATVRKRNTETNKREIVSEPMIFKYNNKFDNIRIVEIDRRASGGRAYKSIITTEDSNKFYVDLRENTLLATILKAGIKPNGYLNGEFAFVKEGSQTNLVRCDSEGYREAVKVDDLKKNQKAIATKDLKPMTLYQRGVNNMDYVLYVGECYIPVIDEVIGGESIGHRGALKRVEDVKATKAKKLRIFIDIFSLENDKDVEEISRKIANYNIKINPSVKVFREVMEIDDSKLSDELFEKASKKFIEDLEWNCGLYPIVYSYWSSREQYHMSADTYKKSLPKACVGRTKEEALKNLDKYKNYHIEKGKYKK